MHVQIRNHAPAIHVLVGDCVRSCIGVVVRRGDTVIRASSHRRGPMRIIRREGIALVEIQREGRGGGCRRSGDGAAARRVVQIDDVQCRHRNRIRRRVRRAERVDNILVPVVGAAGQGIRPGAYVEDVDIAELRGVCGFGCADGAAERIGRAGLRSQQKAWYPYRVGSRRRCKLAFQKAAPALWVPKA